jgi:hypothetical protein
MTKLSKDAKERAIVALTSEKVGKEVADAIDAGVKSDTTGIAGADQVTNMISLTQAEYDAIVTKNPSTFYLITDAV